MEFYFSPPDGCKVDDEFKKEMECLVKEEVDLDGPFDVRCDDIEMKHDFDVESSDAISFSKFNENDIWKGKHAWAINNDDDKISNSDFHLDFIGGSPESALMVNPNIVIPNDRSFLYVNEEDYKVANGNAEKKSVSYSDASTTVEIIKSAKVSNGINLQAKNFLNCFDMSAARSTIEVSVNVDSDHFESSIITSENDKLSQVDENELIFGSKNLKINFQSPKANIKHVLSENKDDNEKIDESKDDYGRIFRSKCIYPKPAFSYSCLISMALKNSEEGCLPVSEIYNFMCNHFPYFKTAPSGWKNSVRHNLSLNKCFEKIEKPPGATQRKGCLWALNPNKAGKMDDEVRKWTSKYRTGIEMSMVFPEHLELLEKGELKNSFSMQDKDEEELCDDEFDDENDSESNRIKDLDLQGASLINISDLDNISCFNSQEENEIFEELLNSVECDNLFNTGGSTSESIITVTAVTNGEEGCSKTNDEYTRTFIDDNIRQIFVPVSVANKSNFLPSKGKKNNLKMNDVLLMRNDAMSKKICNVLMSSKNCDQKAIAGDDLLQFQDISTKGQQQGAKYITVHKSSKSMKSAKKLLLKRLSTFE